jgi:hypothetical protein
MGIIIIIIIIIRIPLLHSRFAYSQQATGLTDKTLLFTALPKTF